MTKETKKKKAVKWNNLTPKQKAKEMKDVQAYIDTIFYVPITKEIK